MKTLQEIRERRRRDKKRKVIGREERQNMGDIGKKITGEDRIWDMGKKGTGEDRIWEIWGKKGTGEDRIWEIWRRREQGRTEYGRYGEEGNRGG
jgi:hypothetical protein